jgi:4-amino-4-deoxy-L-arabinose transferase-like glycosyltransferase
MMGLCVVTLVGLSLRLIYLNEPIRGDEAYTFTQYARRPLFLGLTQYYIPNNHFLNTMLMHFSYLIFGNEPWALRIPVFCAGVLLIPVTYLVGVRLYGPGTALVASALVSSCSVLIEFSTNARGYTLLSLSFLCLLGLATYLCDSKNSAGWIAYIAFAVAGFFTLPTMIYGYSIVVLWLFAILIFNRTRIAKGQLLTYLFLSSVAIACITLLLYWPVWVISDSFADALFRHGAMERGRVFSLFPDYVWRVYLHWTRDFPGVVIWGTLGLFCLGAVGSRVTDRGRVPIALVTAIAILALLIMRPVLPFYRIWLFLLPLYFLVVSSGILNLMSFFKKGNISRCSPLWLVLAMMIVISQGSVTLAKDSVRTSKATGTFLGGEQAVSYIASRMHQNDVVTTSNYTSANVRYYLDRGRLSAKLTWSVKEMVGSQRIFIIVNTLYGETAPELVEYSTLRQAGFNEPALFAIFPHTKVLIMTKTSR